MHEAFLHPKPKTVRELIECRTAYGTICHRSNHKAVLSFRKSLRKYVKADGGYFDFTACKKYPELWRLSRNECY